MKTLTIIGILLILASMGIYIDSGTSGAWMFQAGIILLLGVLAIFAKGKFWDKEPTVEGLAIGLMILVFMWGFFSGMWFTHPLGAIIGLVGGGWAAYRWAEGRFLQSITLNMQSQQWLQYRKWLMIPMGILLVLWLFKSIWVAFAVGFGIVFFLDRQSIQERGINRVATLLVVYLIGFLLLLVVVFKVADTYFEYDLFFSRDAYRLLRGIMRGL